MSPSDQQDWISCSEAARAFNADQWAVARGLKRYGIEVPEVL